MNKIYPLSLSAHYLNYSFPGKFNLETRVFIDIPYPNDFLEYNKETKMISICFEMNSTFNTSNDEIDLGLSILIENKTLYSKVTDLEKVIENNIKEEGPSLYKVYFHDQEKYLYLNLEEKFKDFLMESYSDNWLCFFSENRKNFINKNNKIFINKDEETEDSNLLNKERDKLDKFIIQAGTRLSLILNNLSLDFESIKKHNIKFTNSTILSQITPNEIIGKSAIDSIRLINKTYQYYKMDNKLNNNEIKIKIKKI